jgi:hypothetical protein
MDDTGATGADVRRISVISGDRPSLQLLAQEETFSRTAIAVPSLTVPALLKGKL